MTASVTLLGTGGPKPDPDRMASTTLVRTKDKNYLIDAGRGVTTRLVQAGIEPQDLDAIFITHHHYDHIGNLADLLLSIWNNNRTKKLPIYGPHGTRAIIEAMFSLVYKADITFRYREAAITGDALCDLDEMLEIIEIDQGPVMQEDGLNVTCERVEHGHGQGMTHEEWPCLGFRFAVEYKTIAISGDTVDCPGLGRLAKNADLLVLCCYFANDEQNDFERDVISKYIIVSSAEAGKIATRYAAKTLALTHIRRKSATMLKAMENDIRRDYSGKIIMGEDLLEIAV